MADIQKTIAALLRQAEKASTPEESATYQQKAQELSTRYSIDMEIARTLQAASERRPELVKQGIRIGDSGKRGLHTYYDLLAAIARQNNVQMTLLQDASYAWMHGYDNDVATTEALFNSLLVQMVAESDAYMRRAEYKDELVYREVRTKDRWGYTDSEYKLAPVHGRTARRSFQEAFTHKISARLREARLHAEQDAAAGHFHADDTPLEIQAATNSDSVAIALREITKEVSLFLKTSNPRLAKWKNTRTATGRSAHASSAGTQAGARARISSAKALSR
jgi:NOL1/NOP2/fmu family ribosome biogenesis protein